ncbi:unnamed protein product [Aspergillus oryzae]|nr:unnamed protein product [Aspergillus oryzae]GMF92495.1 unnamed protein product [Aspergillus oryzae]
MSNPYEREAEDRYESQNDPSPVSGIVRDNSYAHETRSELRNQIPVQRDEDDVEDPIQPPFSNSDKQLGKVLDSSGVSPRSLTILQRKTNRRLSIEVTSYVVTACVMQNPVLRMDIVKGLGRTIYPRTLFTDSQEGLPRVELSKVLIFKRTW